MKIKTDQRIKALEIKVAGTVAGLLAKNTQFGFNYHPDSPHSVSITMPVDELHYQHGALFPVFEMNLPEGFVRYRITEQLRKYVPVDEMLFLALQGSKGIGRISYHNSNIELDESKDFPDRRRIENFGKKAGVKNCAYIVDQMADQIRVEIENLSPYLEVMSVDMKSSLLHCLHRVTSRKPLKSHPERRYSKC